MATMDNGDYVMMTIMDDDDGDGLMTKMTNCIKLGSGLTLILI